MRFLPCVTPHRDAGSSPGALVGSGRNSPSEPRPAGTRIPLPWWGPRHLSSKQGHQAMEGPQLMTFRRSPQPPCSEPWVVPSQSRKATGPSNPCPLLAERGEPGTQDHPRLAAVCRGRNAPTPPGCTPKPALTRPAARDVAPGLRGLGRSSEVTVDLGKPWQGHWEARGLPCIWGMSPDGEPWTQVQPSSQGATHRLSVRARPTLPMLLWSAAWTSC